MMLRDPIADSLAIVSVRGAGFRRPKTAEFLGKYACRQNHQDHTLWMQVALLLVAETMLRLYQSSRWHRPCVRLDRR